jgi:prepilin-type N-terminal cleavage/methylation domain-containing protein
LNYELSTVHFGCKKRKDIMSGKNKNKFFMITLRSLRFCAVKKNHGFTLIELVAVLFIVGLIAGMAIPRISNISGVQLRGTARRLSTTIGYVYQSAILKKTNFRICFDVMEHSYFTEERSGEEYVRTSDTLLAPQILPEGVYFRKAVVMDREASEEEDVCLYFTPYGYVEESVIQLENEEGNAGYTLITDTMTGRAIIYEGFVEPEQD